MTPHVLLTVLFIDAGPTRSAWVIVEVRSDGTIVPVQGGWHSMTDIAWLGGLMDSVWSRGGVCCLEYIDGALYDRKRWQDLGETQRVEGDIRTVARMKGADRVLLPFREMPARRNVHPRTLFCVPASSWRKQILHRGGASDAEIALVVLYVCGRSVEYKPGQVERVIDLPAARDRDAREHLYDAIGGALAMVEVFLGVAIRIPDSIRAEQERVRTTARQKKAIRRTLENLGVDPSRASTADGKPIEGLRKRKSSRGVRAGRRAASLNSRDIGMDGARARRRLT